MEKELKCKCGGVMHQEERREQFERIRNGLKDMISHTSEGQLDEFTRNYIGYGPNYMYKCDTCVRLIKFIPDGRKRDL
jgi:hypothetical protein